MSCPDEGALLAFVDGELSSTDSSELERHVDRCDRCRAALSELARALGGDLDPALDTTAFPPDAETAADAESVELFAGDFVDRYEILGELGAGGMGVVYAANDPRLQRQIALKMLRPGIQDASSGTSGRARLLREARSLARLSHPNVVSVFDAGVFGDQVYVAMEFVEGTTLDAWMREEPRPWREVLEVYLQAGRGLAAAHASGLVHRDFKPGNVLIGVSGDVKVADFGLALPADAQLPELDTEPQPNGHPELSRLTRSGAVLGTPAYMSPEQVGAEDADARSDQFSFCVALYEALYGKRPFPGSTVKEIAASAKAGRFREIPERSEVPLWVRRPLLRGLSARRDARYPSMASLLEALEQDPKARRRRLLAVAVALVLIGAIAIIPAALSSRVTCTESRERLAGVWDAAREGAIDAAFRKLGRQWARRSWRSAAAGLEAYAAGWSRMHRDACEATRVRGEQSEDLLDRRMWCLASRRNHLRALTDLLMRPDPRMAREVVAAVSRLPAVEDCADVRALKAAARPPRNAQRRAAVVALRDRLARAEALRTAGRYREALTALRKVVDAARAAKHRPTLARALLVLGETAFLAGETSEAIQMLSEANAAAWAARQDRMAAQAAVALSRTLTIGQKAFAEGRRWARQAAAGVQRLGPSPDLEAAVENAFGTLYAEQGRLELARRHLERSLKLISGRKDAVPLSVAQAHIALGQLDDRAADVTKAIEHFRKALALQTAALGKRHPAVAQTQLQLASVLRTGGRYGEALPLQRGALAVLQQTLGDDNTRTAQGASTVALTLQRLGRYREAVKLRRRALSITERRLGSQHPRVAQRLNDLGQTLAAIGEYREAEKLHRRALAIFLETVGAGDFRVARTRSDIGVTLQNQGRQTEAVSVLRLAVRGYERVYGGEHPLLGNALGNLGVALQMSGRRAEAIAVLKRSLRIYEERLGRRHPLVAYTLTHLGTANYLLAKYDRALELFQRARAIRESALGKDHQLVAWLLTNEAVTYQRQRRWRRSVAALERSLSILVKRDHDPNHLAKVRFYLGVGLWESGQDRKRARRLALEAERYYAGSGRKPRRLRRIKTWLRTHKVR